jgi:hypothetical protein
LEQSLINSIQKNRLFKTFHPLQVQVIFDIGDGIGGIILNILVWIIAALVLSFLFFYALGAILWISILTFKNALLGIF